MNRIRRAVPWALVVLSGLFAILGLGDVLAGIAFEPTTALAITGKTVDEIQAESPAGYAVIDYIYRGGGITLALFATLMTIVLAIPYRRAERWAWGAALVAPRLGWRGVPARRPPRDGPGTAVVGGRVVGRRLRDRHCRLAARRPGPIPNSRGRTYSGDLPGIATPRRRRPPSARRTAPATQAPRTGRQSTRSCADLAVTELADPDVADRHAVAVVDRALDHDEVPDSRMPLSCIFGLVPVLLGVLLGKLLRVLAANPLARLRPLLDEVIGGVLVR